MKTYSVSEAREHFADLLSSVERGEEVAITRHGTLIATITHPSASKTGLSSVPAPGFLKTRGWSLEMTEDFDDIPEGFGDYV